MAVGLATVDFVNRVLNHMLRAVASTAPADNYVQLHTADPGAAGTTSPVAGAVRVAITYSAASAGSCVSSNTPSWVTWAHGSVTISYLAVFDLATGGVFLYSMQLTTAKAITNGDTFTLATVTVSIVPLAA